MNKEITICPKCIRQLRNINAWHYCAEVSIDDLFADKSDDILLVFDEILQRVSIWDDVAVSATKNCVVFVKNKTFLVLKPMTKFMEIKFHSREFIEDEDLHKCAKWGGKYEGIFRLQNTHQLSSKVFNYIKESYQIS